MSVLPWLCAGVILATAVPAAPDEALVDRAEEAYESGNYADAAEAFGAAYAADPDPRLLYAQAQATRLADNCEDAIPLYDRFIEVSEDPDAIDAATTNRDTCKETIARRPPLPPTLVAPPPSDAPATTDEPPSRRWYRDPAGGALVGAGAGAVVLGVVLRQLAARRYSDAITAKNEGGFESNLQAARTMNGTGLVFLGVGATAMVAGVVRWIVVATR